MTPTIETTDSRLPERLYLAIAAVFGLLFTFLIPPFQAPDEATHLFKALQIAEGRAFGQLENGIPGGRFSETWGHYMGLFGNLPGRPDRKVEPGTWTAARNLDWSAPGTIFFDYRNTVLYTPVPYLPQALGMKVSEWLRLPPFWWMYLGRLFNLAAGLLLVFAAIRKAPTQKWLLLGLALMPMTVFLSATLSADVVTTGLCFLLIAWVMREKSKEGPLATSSLVGIALVSILIALSKQVYFPISFLCLLLPASRFRDSRTRYAFYFFSIGFGLGLSLLWTLALKQRDLFLRMAERPHDLDVQLDLILRDPLGYLGILFGTIKNHYAILLEQFVGQLGWLDTILPKWLWVSYATLLPCLAVADSDPGFSLRGKERGLIALSWAASVFLLFLALYLQASPIGAEYIGCQGRYFIPLAPLFFLLLSHRKGSLRLTRFKAVRLAIAVALTGALIETAMLLLKRYHAA